MTISCALTPSAWPRCQQARGGSPWSTLFVPLFVRRCASRLRKCVEDLRAGTEGGLWHCLQRCFPRGVLRLGQWVYAQPQLGAVRLRDSFQHTHCQALCSGWIGQRWPTGGVRWHNAQQQLGHRQRCLFPPPVCRKNRQHVRPKRVGVGGQPSSLSIAFAFSGFRCSDPSEQLWRCASFSYVFLHPQALRRPCGCS